jgi:hypothetical protein
VKNVKREGVTRDTRRDLRKGQVGGGGKRKRVIPYGDCRRNGVPFREVNRLLPSKWRGMRKMEARKSDGEMEKTME